MDVFPFYLDTILSDNIHAETTGWMGMTYIHLTMNMLLFDVTKYDGTSWSSSIMLFDVTKYDGTSWSSSIM